MLLLVPLAVVFCGGGAALWDWLHGLPPGRKASYVGTHRCTTCHADEARLWAGSDHDLAMDHARPDTVLADFSNADLVHHDRHTQLRRDGDRFLVTTDGPNGQPHTYQVKYTFGVRPLQQYLVEFPDGRVQCLPWAWNVAQRRWFHLYPDESLPAGDWLHWTGAGQNWNYMCAECHSTGVRKNYDSQTNRYHTTFTDIDVGCETCHGPGSLHVELAESSSLFWDRNHGYGMPNLAGPRNDEEIASCAPCHARRRLVAANYQPGQPLFDHYFPELLDGQSYYPDGQIRDEVYEFGSFTQSKMYHKNVRCSDCHEPHSLTLRGTGNALCTRCHTAARFDTPAHHHHLPQGAGAACVECHMPSTTYMQVDPRRDHSLRIPRPDLTVSLGTPNACQPCHRAESADWAAQHVTAWYGPARAKAPHFATAIAAGRAGDPAAVPLLARWLATPSTPALVRASAAALLGQYPGPVAQRALTTALADRSPLVRTMAVAQLSATGGDAWAMKVAERVADVSRPVRQEAARALVPLVGQGWNPPDRIRFEQALAEYRQAQFENLDQPAACLNLAVIHTDLGQFDDAERDYRSALALDPRYTPAMLNLATLVHQRGDTPAAEQLLKQVIAEEPLAPHGYYSLGLLLGEQPARLAEAEPLLARAVQLAPADARRWYNWGLALEQLSRWPEARAALDRAVELAPQDLELLHALTLAEIELADWNSAQRHADLLVERLPHDRAAQELRSRIPSRTRSVRP